MIANIALDNALILPHGANPAGLNFRERHYVERLIGTIRMECLDHLIVFGEAHLRRRIFKGRRHSRGCRQRI